MPIPGDLVSILLGPLGALFAALYAVRVLWLRCERLEAELRAEREARLTEAKAVADRLLGTWGKVSGAIESLERLTLHDLPAVTMSVPPERGG